MVISVFLFSKPFNRYNVEFVHFNSGCGDSVDGILYTPIEIKGKKFPAILSVHSGLQNREALQPVARVLAESDIVVLNLILKKERNIDGKRKSFEDYISDVRAGADYLLGREFIDENRVFLSGHSIGANVTSTVTALHKKVAGEIAVGYPVEFLPSCRKHLLMTAGVFDELHSVSKMLFAFDATSGRNTDRLVLYKPREMHLSPEKISRVYFISFLTDHYTEPLDPDIAEAISCFIKSLKNEDFKNYKFYRGIRAQIFTRITLFLSLFLIFFMAFIEIYFVGVNMGISKIIAMRIGIIFFVLLFIIIGLIHRPGEHLIHIYILSSMFLALMAANLFVSKSTERHRKESLKNGEIENTIACNDKLTRFFKNSILKVIVYIMAFYFGYILGIFVHAGFIPYSKSAYIWCTIWGPLFMVPAQIYVFCTRINGLFLRNDFTFNFASYIIWIILMVEMVYPGAVGKLLDEFFARMIGSIQKLDFKIRLKFSVAEFVILIVVLIACVLLWKQILSEGYSFGFTEFLDMGYLFLSFIIIPVAVFTAIIRSKKIKRFIESHF